MSAQQWTEEQRKEWAEAPHPDDPRSELGNDGLTDEEREAGVAPLFGLPLIIDTSANDDQWCCDTCRRLSEAMSPLPPSDAPGGDS